MTAGINVEWHHAHRMPKRPSIHERFSWHLEHSRNCHCREAVPRIRKAGERPALQHAGK
jgi:hypothetical protein